MTNTVEMYGHVPMSARVIQNTLKEASYPVVQNGTFTEQYNCSSPVCSSFCEALQNNMQTSITQAHLWLPAADRMSAERSQNLLQRWKLLVSALIQMVSCFSEPPPPPTHTQLKAFSKCV